MLLVGILRSILSKIDNKEGRYERMYHVRSQDRQPEKDWKCRYRISLIAFQNSRSSAEERERRRMANRKVMAVHALNLKARRSTVAKLHTHWA